MKFADERAIQTAQWFPNEILREVDINSIGEQGYINITNKLGALVKQRRLSESVDYALSGVRLTHNNLLTTNIDPGFALSFAGYYLTSGGTWGYQASPGDIFSVVVGDQQAVAFNSGSSEDRIDMVEIRPVEIEYDSKPRNFKDPVTGLVSTTPANVKKEYGYEFAVREGTPGVQGVTRMSFIDEGFSGPGEYFNDYLTAYVTPQDGVPVGVTIWFTLNGSGSPVLQANTQHLVVVNVDTSDTGSTIADNVKDALESDPEVAPLFSSIAKSTGANIGILDFTFATYGPQTFTETLQTTSASETTTGVIVDVTASTAGWIKIAEVLIPASASAITQDNIKNAEDSGAWIGGNETRALSIGAIPKTSPSDESVVGGLPIGKSHKGDGTFENSAVNFSTYAFPLDEQYSAQVDGIVTYDIDCIDKTNKEYVVVWIERTGTTLSYRLRVFRYDSSGEVEWLTDEYNWAGGADNNQQWIQVRRLSDDYFAILRETSSGGSVWNGYVGVWQYNNDFADPTPGTITQQIAWTASSYDNGSNYEFGSRMEVSDEQYIWVVNDFYIYLGTWNGSNNITWLGTGAQWDNFSDRPYGLFNGSIAPLEDPNVGPGIAAGSGTNDAACVIQVRYDGQNEAQKGERLYIATYNSTEDTTEVKFFEAENSRHEGYVGGVCSIDRANNLFLQGYIGGDGIVVRLGKAHGLRHDVEDPAYPPSIQWLDRTEPVQSSAAGVTRYYLEDDTAIEAFIRPMGGGFFMVYTSSDGTNRRRVAHIGRVDGESIQWTYKDVPLNNVEMSWIQASEGADGVIALSGIVYASAVYTGTDTRDVWLNTWFIGCSADFQGFAAESVGVSSEVQAITSGEVEVDTSVVGELLTGREYYFNPYGKGSTGVRQVVEIDFTGVSFSDDSGFAFWSPDGKGYQIWWDTGSFGKDRIPGVTEIGFPSTVTVKQISDTINNIVGFSCSVVSGSKIEITCSEPGEALAPHWSPIAGFGYTSTLVGIGIVQRGFDPVGLTTKPTRYRVGRALSPSRLLLYPDQNPSNLQWEMSRSKRVPLMIYDGKVGTNRSTWQTTEVDIKEIIVTTQDRWDMSVNDGFEVPLPFSIERIAIVGIDAFIMNASSATRFGMLPLNGSTLNGGLSEGGVVGFSSGKDGIVLIRRASGAYSSYTSVKVLVRIRYLVAAETYGEKEYREFQNVDWGP